MARMAKALPVTGKRGRSERRHSDECVRIMGGIDSLGTRHTGGLNQAAWALRSIDVAEVLIEMTGAQCVRALQVIGECEDMLDAIKALIERRQVAAS